MQESTRADPREELHQFIDAEAETLLRSIRLYVVRAGLASGPAIQPLANEVLNETVAEALDHAERLAGVVSLHAWLLGIAANLVRRRQTRQIKHQQREPLAMDLRLGSYSEEDIFDRLHIASAHLADPAREVEARDTIAYLLAPLTPEDRYLVRLAILHELPRRVIAQELNISPAAVRVRLHRALARLRKAYEGKNDE